MNTHRNPQWLSLASRAFTTFSQPGIPSIFLRYPDYIYADIFKNWCEQNDINFYKRKGKRTRKRIMRNFKRDMRHLSRLYHAGAITPHYQNYQIRNLNVKMMEKISNILDDFHNFQVDLTVTLLNGDQYNDVVVGNVRMHEVFSKIRKNVNISDNANFYIIDGVNNEYLNTDGSIYIASECSLISLLRNCCPNYYELNLGVIV